MLFQDTQFPLIRVRSEGPLNPQGSGLRSLHGPGPAAPSR
jgi:hypothetical protein